MASAATCRVRLHVPEASYTVSRPLCMVHAHQVAAQMHWSDRATPQPPHLRKPPMRLASRVRCQPVVDTVKSRSSEERDFMELAEICGTGLNKVTAQTTGNQVGLVATEAVEKGEILIQVPLAACLSFDDEAGITLPDAAWPQLAAAVTSAQTAERPPTWDMLIALALVDAQEGSGDPFTEQYIKSFMPSPRAIATPFCQSAAGLDALQHPKVAEAALQRRKILDEAFPDLSNVFLDGTDTTPLQWGLACVRSRAFQLTTTLFAQVPFCDLANHSDRPNAMVRPLRVPQEGEEEDSAQEPEGLDRDLRDLENSTRAPEPKRRPQPPGNNLSVALVATEDISAGSEVTISYTGASGATNRRLMVQYGFVIPDNPHDRLDFELFEGYVGTTPLRGAPGAALSLSRIQDHLGDDRFQELLAGGDVPLLCALKSIPTYSMEASELPNSKQVLRDERLMLEKLLDKLEDIEQEFSTTLRYDETMRAQPGLSAWARAALQYRIERKKIAAAARKVLEIYREIVREGTK